MSTSDPPAAPALTGAESDFVDRMFVAIYSAAQKEFSTTPPASDDRCARLEAALQQFVIDIRRKP